MTPALREGDGLAHWVDVDDQHEIADTTFCGDSHTGAIPHPTIPECVRCAQVFEGRRCPTGGLR